MVLKFKGCNAFSKLVKKEKPERSTENALSAEEQRALNAVNQRTSDSARQLADEFQTPAYASDATHHASGNS